MIPVFRVNEQKNREFEYLLTRGLAPEKDLALALIESEWPRLYWLAALLTGSPAEARRISVAVIADALPSAKKYRADIPLAAWLDRAVFRASGKRLASSRPVADDAPGASHLALWQAFDHLGAARLPVLLHLLLALSPAELAIRLEEKPAAVQARLEAALERLGADLQSSPHVDTGYAAPPLIETTAESLALRWPVYPMESDPQTLANEALAARQAGQSRGWLRQARGSVWFIAAAALAAVIFLRFGDNLFPTLSDPTPPPTLSPTDQPRQRRTPRPQPTPVPTLADPLTLRSSPEDVRARILNSASDWDTFWADALVIQYGPDGYVGPPAVSRSQVWIEQPDRALALAGPRTGQASSVWSLFGDSSFGIDLRSGMVFYERDQLPPESSPLLPFVPVTGPTAPNGQSLAGFYLADLLFPGQTTLPDGNFRVNGQEQVAGRDTLTVDWTPNGDLNPARLWVDTLTGTVLRWRSFSMETPGLVLQDMILTGLAFDFEFPDGFFDPRSLRNESLAWGALWQPGPPEVAQDTAWGAPPVRDRLRRSRPPSDFNPAQEVLTLQWPRRANRETLSSTDAEIFSGGYYIGEVNLDDPWQLQCQRSPDGQMVAFVPESLPALNPSFQLSWFRLDDLGQVYPMLTADQTSSDFAFSPDSSRLAFHGCTGGNQCGVYLLDTQTRQNVSLFSVENAGWLAWSPDGSQLAFIGIGSQPFPDRVWRLFVVDVTTGVVDYAAPIALDQREIPAGAPVAEWDAAYPPSQPGLEGCLAPPVNQERAFQLQEDTRRTP